MSVVTPFRAKAIWSVGAVDKDQELGFIEGDIIEVSRVYDNGAGYGKSLRTKLAGVFPMKYVKPLEISESPSRRSISSLVNSPSTHSLSRKDITLSGDNNVSSKSSLTRLTRDLSHVSLDTTSSYIDGFASRYEDTNTSDDGSIAPLPPKHSYTSQNFNSYNKSIGLNKSDYWNSSNSQSKVLDSSLFSTDTERSSYFGHSDFSATSASSFMRHKASTFQQRLKNIEEKGSNEERNEILQELVADSKSTKHPNFFKRFMSKKEEVLTIDDKIFKSSDKYRINGPEVDVSIGAERSTADSLHPDKGIAMDPSHEMDLERAKTLSSRERSQRKLKALEIDRHLILHPHKSITSVNKNEVTASFHKSTIDSIPLQQVDMYIQQLPYDKYATLQKIAQNKVGTKFKTEIERLRALYMYCTEKLTIVKSRKPEKLSTRHPPSDLEDVLFTGKCTSFQLTWIFFVMASFLDIQIEIILGHLKTPFEYEVASQNGDSSLVLNHAWISVLISGEYRFIDVGLGNSTNPYLLEFNLDEPSYEDNREFYFLVRPLDLIYTHTPLHIDNQHITPPVDPIMQMVLPPLYPSFLLNGLRFYKFDHSLFRLQDYQVSEFDLEIPEDVHISAEISCAESASFRALTQIYWKKDRRLAKIKTILPPQCSMGFLTVYSKVKGFNESSKAALSLSIPVYHFGKYKQLEWVKLNENHLKSTDIYIKSPQILNLQCKEIYTFNIIIHHHKAAEQNRTLANLLSPSGKLFELERADPQLPDHLELVKQLREVGVWRLIVPNDNYTGWHIFCEWECVA